MSNSQIFTQGGQNIRSLNEWGNSNQSQPQRSGTYQNSRIVDANGNPIPKPINARYEALSNGPELSRYYAKADYLTPEMANSPSVRRLLRSRSRYECLENSSYIKGMMISLANDVVGTGPKLQIIDDKWSPAVGDRVEALWDEWVEESKFVDKLWEMSMHKRVDGEGIMLTSYKPTMESPVQMALITIESEQLTDPSTPREVAAMSNVNQIDGIKFDEWGDPVAYYIIPYRPNDYSTYREGAWYPARRVYHWFRKDRPWSRGIPELTPSLPLCAMLRRYRNAVVLAAETAADFAAILYSEQPASTDLFGPNTGIPNERGDYAGPGQFDQFPIEKGMFTVMPYGYKMGQLKAEQPIQAYNEFVNALLREIARPLLLPFGIASGSSQEANMSSAVVDANLYQTSVKLERKHFERNCLNRMFNEFYTELSLQGFKLPAEKPRKLWRWDRVGIEHTDPEKVAAAYEIYQRMGVMTDDDLQEILMNRSLEDLDKLMARQMKFRDKHDITIPELVAPPVPAAPAGDGKAPIKKQVPGSTNK